MLSIEMTGKEDMESPWKYAICGFPGTGKTMLSSTAPDPLFVFFQENPRLKSIADRHIPHVKVFNDEQGTVIEKMLAMSHHLAIADHDYKTLVIDTGDELFQAMKEARRIQNGGEFGRGDWDWLGDTYREMMTGLIDLPMRIIVLFHVKNASDEEGTTTRELLLQGAAKDQAAGWFDVVAMLDTYEVTDEEGETHTRRVLLTHSSRLNPWVKDHSGKLPRKYELSSSFVGDIEEIEKTLNKEVSAEREELDTIPSLEEPAEGDEDTPVPSPDDLKAKKEDQGNAPDETATVTETEATETEETVTDTSAIEKAQETVQEVLGATEVEEESEGSDAGDPPETEADEEKPQDKPVTTADIPKASDEQPEEVVFKCEECGDEVDNEDLINMSRAKYKSVLCRQHFKARMRGTN